MSSKKTEWKLVNRGALFDLCEDSDESRVLITGLSCATCSPGGDVFEVVAAHNAATKNIDAVTTMPECHDSLSARAEELLGRPIRKTAFPTISGRVTQVSLERHYRIGTDGSHTYERSSYVRVRRDGQSRREIERLTVSDLAAWEACGP
jgi:hypothetical protein